MRAIFLFVALILGLSACAGGGAPSGACVDNGQCDEGEACIFEVCEAVQCLSSNQCGIREFCDLDTYACRAGCEEDADCRAGESCNTGSNTCEVYGCRDTELDCGIGEVCNAVTGECVFDNAGHCDRCEPDIWEPSGTCRNSTAVCGAFQDAPNDNFCFQQCSPANTEACPRGYACIQGFFGDGNAYCAAYCPTLYENGWK